MSLVDGDDGVMDDGAVGPSVAGDAVGISSRGVGGVANSYADLPALTSTPVVADLALTQGLTQDKEGAAGVSNLVDVLRQVWINERGERQQQWTVVRMQLPSVTCRSQIVSLSPSAVAAAAPELLNYEQNVVDDVKAAVDQRVRHIEGHR